MDVKAKLKPLPFQSPPITAEGCLGLSLPTGSSWVGRDNYDIPPFLMSLCKARLNCPSFIKLMGQFSGEHRGKPQLLCKGDIAWGGKATSRRSFSWINL